MQKNNIKSVGKASIREVKKVVDDVEKETSLPFVRMEMGVPGLPTVKVGVDAQIQALKDEYLQFIQIFTVRQS